MEKKEKEVWTLDGRKKILMVNERNQVLYEVKDLGTGVSDTKILEAVKQHNAQFVGLSALLTTTMIKMRSVIELLKAEGLRDKVMVLIGGAPTSPEFAQEIGANAHCRDAFDALETMEKI